MFKPLKESGNQGILRNLQNTLTPEINYKIKENSSNQTGEILTHKKKRDSD